MTDTTSSTQTHRPVRRPLSALRPAAAIARAADRCASLLRHPRSRIRVTPGWRAPSTTVLLPAGSATVFLSRHRVSPTLWRKLTGTPAHVTVPDSPLFLVTLSALTEPSHLTGTVRDMTVSVHSLFRLVLDPDSGTGPGWINAETCGREHPEGSPTERTLEWTWHALMTGTQLEDSPGGLHRGTTSGEDRAA